MQETVGGFARLATVSDLLIARVLAARLESEGIEVRLHGESLGPYRLTVGEWALTELWVPADRLEEAGGIMLAAEVDDALGGLDPPERGPTDSTAASESGIPVGTSMAIALVMVAALIARLVVILL